MSYPFGATIANTLPDLPITLLKRRQGDVKATLLTLTLNGQPINIAGWTFTFSVSFPAPIGVMTVVWTVQAPSNGLPITTVSSGFSIPSFSSSISASFASTSQFVDGSQIFIAGAGVYTITNIATATQATITNTGLEGNLPSGNVAATTSVYQVGQLGKTVLVIPASISGNAPGLYPFFVKYQTNDLPPGPYVVTCMDGELELMTD